MKPKMDYSTLRRHARRVETMRRSNYPESQDMSKKQMKCPGCGRATCHRDRIYLGKEYIKTLPKPEGLVYAVRRDGTCDRCWRIEREKSGKPVGKRTRDRSRYYHEITDEEIERAQEGLREYWIQRRLRGVPPEGIFFPGDPL